VRRSSGRSLISGRMSGLLSDVVPKRGILQTGSMITHGIILRVPVGSGVLLVLL
jgi:hypothetical protein